MKRYTVYLQTACIIAPLMLVQGCAEEPASHLMDRVDTPETGAKNASAPAQTADERALLQKADTARALGNTVEAQRYYEAAAKASTGSVRAHLELADIYQQQKQTDQAIALLKQAHTLVPNHVETLKKLAELFLQTGNDKEAGQYAMKGLRQHSKDTRLLNIKGILQDRESRHREAQRTYEQALEHAAAQADKEYTVNNLALSLIASTDYGKAIDLLEAHLPKAENPSAFRQTLALAYGVQGDENKAYELGLHDLSIEEARENLYFYQQYRKDMIDRDVLFQNAAEAARLGAKH